MNLISSIELENFKCFKQKEKVNLLKSSYLIGPNNAGKTAILNGLNFFFDPKFYVDESFLNKTVFLGKGSGFNKTKITLGFNLQAINLKKLGQSLTKQYKSGLSIQKRYTFKTTAKTIVWDYVINNNKPCTEDNLPSEIRQLLSGIKISYLHPQEGKELLNNALRKLRERLLANWGRRPTIANSLDDLQKRWSNFRNQANAYLSKSLTGDIQHLWDGSIVKIDLPKNIKDILKVSEINFQGNKTLPEINLTSQGTGVQSSVLYFTHFLLDSDRTLHRGFYYPIWLLEEPESFLHNDLLLKLGKELNSEHWLNNIQMVVSTHSPVLLATSRMGGDKVLWNLIGNSALQLSKAANVIDDDSLDQIAHVMGDANFAVYFWASDVNNLLFVEDTKELTLNKYNEKGIIVTRSLNGTGEVEKYLKVLASTKEIVSRKAYFIIDNDQGKKAVREYIRTDKLLLELNGFQKYRITDKLFLILLPNGYNCESLFEEYDDHLEDCVKLLYRCTDFSFKKHIPSYLSRTHADLRDKGKPRDIVAAKDMIRNSKDVKDTFWKKVESEGYSFADDKIESLKKLID
jgi:hypothetical protein